MIAKAPLVREVDPDRNARPVRRGPPPPILYEQTPLPKVSTYARGRELGSLLFLAAATFLMLALGSYHERGGADWVGPVGAQIAAVIVSGIGLVAWAIPIELTLFAIPFLRSRPSVISVSRAASDVVVAATAAALIHVGAAGRPVFGSHAAGGVIGELFGEVLRSLFSTVGTFLVGLTIIGLVLIARATFSFIEFANRAASTSAAMAVKAKGSARGVADAWQQARALERAGGIQPTLFPNGFANASPGVDGSAGAVMVARFQSPSPRRRRGARRRRGWLGGSR
ncbi:MAG: hypothetical protein NVSMB1_23770 [Polyangiales bacterium]